MLTTLLMCPLLALLTVWNAQQAAPPETIPQAELESVLEGLRTRTLGLKAFVAQYESGDPETPAGMTLCYAAPDRAAVVVRMGPATMRMWSRDGRIDLLFTQPDGAFVASFSPRELAAPYAGFHEVLRAEFVPPDEPRPDLGPGPFLAINFGRDPNDPKRTQLDVRVAWEERRAHVLGWLTNAQRWKDATREEETLVLEPVPDQRFVLDLATGFPRGIYGKTGALSLAQLELDGEVPEECFAAPAPEPSAQDLGQKYADQYRVLLRTMHRKGAYDAAGRMAARGPEAAADLDARATRVFRALHAVIASLHFADWMERTRQQIDERAAEWERRRALATDDVARAALRKEVADWRGALVAAMDSGVEQYLRSLEEAPPSELDEALLARIRAAEVAGAREALAEGLTGPTLEWWDQRFAQGEGGR